MNTVFRNWEILVNARPLHPTVIVRAKTHDGAIDEYLRTSGSRAYNISAKRI